MSQNRPGPGAPLASIKSITLYLEDENGVRRPTVYPAARCILGGVQGGIPVARVLNEEGDLEDFIGCAMRIVQGPPSGLVAPAPGSGGGVLRST